MEIDILGEFRARRGADLLPAPQRRQIAVLITIALAGQPFTDDICNHLDQAQPGRPSISRDSIYTHISGLNGAGFRIETVKHGQRKKYLLDPASCVVDAWHFAERVRSLTRPIEPEEADELLALWRGDPRSEHSDVNPDLWRPYFEARDTLAEHITAIPSVRRAQMRHLTRFLGLFPADHLLDQIRPPVLRTPGKHLLIVEDKVGPTIVAELEEAGYKCTLRTSWEDWDKLKKNGLPEFHGALIDLHLRSTDDRMGLWVVKFLRDHTSIPTAVVTNDPEETSYYRKGTWLARYRLVDLVEKNNRDRYLRALPDTARLLTSNDRESRKQRLRTWLNTAVYMASWEAKAPGAGQLARDRLERCHKAAQRAGYAIDYGTIDEAQREVDALCKEYPPQER